MPLNYAEMHILTINGTHSFEIDFFNSVSSNFLLTHKNNTLSTLTKYMPYFHIF